MFLRLMDYDAVFGVTGALLDGLDELERRRRPRCSRACGIARRAPRRVRAAGRAPGSRRCAFALCGPALAIGREPGGPAFVAGRRVGARRREDGRVCVTSRAAARADVRAHADRRARHDRRRRHRPDGPRRGVAMAKRPLISADNHVFEPVTLWQERLPARSSATAGPRVEQRDDWIVMAIEGMPDRKLTRVERRRATAATPARRRARAGGFDLDGRLRDMALDGVVAEVIYPTFGLFIDMMPGARSPDGVRAGLQRLARRVVPAPARRVHPGRGRAGARRRVGDRRARARRAARLQGRDDPDVARPRAAVQPARLRPAVEDRERRGHAALAAHRHRRAAAARARARAAR